MKRIVYIRGNRTGYSPNQCGETMTVGDLIHALEDFDMDSPVYLNNDNGYTFGEISPDDIWGSDAEDTEGDEDEDE